MMQVSLPSSLPSSCDDVGGQHGAALVTTAESQTGCNTWLNIYLFLLLVICWTRQLAGYKGTVLELQDSVQ